MYYIKKHLVKALVLGIAWHTFQGVAMAQIAPNECFYDPGPGPKSYLRELRTVYLPGDAEIGSVIGPSRRYEFTHDDPRLRCQTYGERMTMDFQAIRGVHGPLPPIDGEDLTGFVLKTNIPGIGVRIELGNPFTGTGNSDHMTPIGRNPPLIPFTAYYEQSVFTYFSLRQLTNTVTLIKTGPLQPGVHQVDGPLFSGHLDYVSQGVKGRIIEYSLRATVVQAECTITGDPVSANPILLGDWSKAEFTGPGYTTRDVPFQIRLGSCQTDPENDTYATLELQGINGSQPIGPIDKNIFSLTSDSDARGVGIQMLHDGQPLPLNTEVPLVPLVDGTTLLNFHARFFQVDDSNDVHPGVAKGALNFTIRYR